MSEDRSAYKAQFARRRIEDRVAGDVGGHHVGGELHTRVSKRQRLRQGTHEQRFPEARHAFDQDVPRRDERDEHLLNHGRLPHHRVTDGRAESIQQSGRAWDAGYFSFSVCHARTFCV